MMEKLKAKREALVAEEAALVSKLEKVRGKIGIVDEMIADETPAVEAKPAQEAPQRTIEFGTVKPRTSF